VKHPEFEIGNVLRVRRTSRGLGWSTLPKSTRRERKAHPYPHNSQNVSPQSNAQQNLSGAPRASGDIHRLFSKVSVGGEPCMMRRHIFLEASALDSIPLEQAGVADGCYLVLDAFLLAALAPAQLGIFRLITPPPDM